MKQSHKVLTEKMIERELQIFPSRSRIKSGVIPFAQTVTLLQTGSGRARADQDTNHSLELIKTKNLKLWYLIKFMSASACRINEALKIKCVDVTQQGHVKLQTSKKGKSRIVSGGMASDYLIECKAKSRAPFSDWSRWYVYRELKKYNFQTQLSGRKNKTVTHTPRHLAAKALKQNGNDITDSQQLLGQSSLNSTRFYHE